MNYKVTIDDEAKQFPCFEKVTMFSLAPALKTCHSELFGR
jgi:hypothetical protein